MYKIVQDLILAGALNDVKLERNCIHLQKTLTNKKYDEMSFFKVFANVDHHLPLLVGVQIWLLS